MHLSSAVLSEVEFDGEIDLSGLNCPLPVLKTKATLARMNEGEILKVTVTHPDSVKEFEAFCRLPENVMVHFIETDPAYLFYIRKASK